MLYKLRHLHLLIHYEVVLKDIQEGHNSDVIYIDFAKAFDKVDHGILLHKVKQQGISGHIGRWIHNFLTNRSQIVTIQGQWSAPSTVLSGVPQGSVLGPLLFLIMVNDIDSGLRHSTTTSFADDTRIRKQIKSQEETNLMQKDLNTIMEWADINNMALNRDKFELLRYGKNNNTKSETNYQCQDHNIKAKDHVKDLGVYMSSDGTFSHHYSKITQAARQLSGWILRTFTTREKTCMLTLWKSLVLPKMEYCCQLWSPHKTTDIMSIEAIQRSFTSRIAGLNHLNYWERLKHLNLYSLQRRRERYIIMYVWKVLEKLVPDVGLTETNNPRRGRLCFVQHTQASTQGVKTLIHHSFSHNGACLFNCAPRSLRELRNIAPNTFKHHLDKWLASIVDHPPTPGYTNYNTNSLPSILQESRREELDRPGMSGGPP